MDFHPNDSRMFGERQDCPVPEILIDRHQYPLLSDGKIQDGVILSAALSDLGSPGDVVPLISKNLRQTHLEHLVQVEPHPIANPQ